MNVGDLVRYKYLQKDLGIIVEVRTELSFKQEGTYKVMWFGPNAAKFQGAQCDWMRETGLEVLSELK
jgi:hypothetical protein